MQRVFTLFGFGYFYFSKFHPQYCCINFKITRPEPPTWKLKRPSGEILIKDLMLNPSMNNYVTTIVLLSQASVHTPERPWRQPSPVLF